MADGRWLIVGLGNPGPEYAATRHNIGFLVVDELARRMGGSLGKHRRATAEVLEGRLQGEPTVLARSRTYMNTSGGPVKALVGFYKVPLDHLIVIHDDLDLPLGTLRLKAGGGHGGHNGLRSIASAMGSPDFIRVRCGIGRPPGRQDPADYVLRPFGSKERVEAELLVQRAADAIEDAQRIGLEATQNRVHSEPGADR